MPHTSGRTGGIMVKCVSVCETTESNSQLYLLAGAVASMFWVDAELGSEIYLDGKKIVFIINVFH